MKFIQNLISYREVIWSLAIRETLVRYRLTWLGAIWTLLPTLLLLGALDVAFSSAFKEATGDIPYHLFALTGLVPWVFTTAAISRAAASLVGNVDLVTRLYIPREVFPVAAIGSRALDFCIGLSLLMLLSGWQGYLFSAGLVHLPAVIAIHLIFLLALSLPIAVLAIPIRDITYAMNYAVMIWLFFTPVCYPLASLSPNRQFLLGLNPMTWITEAYRDVLIRGVSPWSPAFCTLAVLSLTFSFLSYGFFRRLESRVVEML